MVKTPSLGLRRAGGPCQKNDQTIFQNAILYYGWQKVIILGAARQGETLKLKNGSDTIRREILPEMGSAREALPLKSPSAHS
jgi:hypothetical protein